MVSGLLRIIPRHDRPHRTAQPLTSRAADRAQRAGAQREPRPALYGRLPRTG